MSPRGVLRTTDLDQWWQMQTGYVNNPPRCAFTSTPNLSPKQMSLINHGPTPPSIDLDILSPAHQTATMDLFFWNFLLTPVQTPLSAPLQYFILFDFLIFYFFEGCTCSIWRFPGYGRIGAAAAGLHHSHSNARSEPHLWPIPQLMAIPDP